MNKKDFEKKVDELVAMISTELKEKCMKLYSSGGIDPEGFDNDFILPKIVLYAALPDIRDSRKPLSVTHLNMAKKLEDF